MFWTLAWVLGYKREQKKATVFMEDTSYWGRQAWAVNM